MFALGIIILSPKTFDSQMTRILGFLYANIHIPSTTTSNGLEYFRKTILRRTQSPWSAPPFPVDVHKYRDLGLCVYVNCCCRPINIFATE